MNTPVTVPGALSLGNYVLGGGEELFFILGPCVIESEQLTLDVAAEVARIGRSTGVPVLFKSSFDKANRTSQESFRGPGLREGLRILSEVKAKTGLPIVSDIHTPDQAGPAATVTRCDPDTRAPLSPNGSPLGRGPNR